MVINGKRVAHQLIQGQPVDIRFILSFQKSNLNNVNLYLSLVMVDIFYDAFFVFSSPLCGEPRTHRMLGNIDNPLWGRSQRN